MNQAARADAVQLYAAGSLRAALTDVSKAFRAVSGVAVQGKYDPSDILKDEIARGAKADVFASANMTHPQTLAETGKSGPVVLFARNRLCALVRPGLGVTTANLLDRMLDPEIKLGTSMPKADPSGDYAFEVFGKAEGLRRGARAALQGKALQLTGGPSSVQPPAGRNAYAWHVAEGRADIFLAYCTATREAAATASRSAVRGAARCACGGGRLRTHCDKRRRTLRPEICRLHPFSGWPENAVQPRLCPRS